MDDKIHLGYFAQDDGSVRYGLSGSNSWKVSRMASWLRAAIMAVSPILWPMRHHLHVHNISLPFIVYMNLSQNSALAIGEGRAMRYRAA
ncbi:MAG: hypothetical protein B7Z70_00215 [Acidithiobacillus ferrivorans]|uniref:Uncharacterized protein n=1 Tax=Acidithiobacillus ferrivorans TaxID=160808 RepID=A0A257TBR4_9PROT|nr:MAG: hypothetical protein B7Z70_00215 [Acidithiobacillus ferrivorans]